MGSSGLHNDNNSLDVFYITNEDRIRETVPLKENIFFVDRGITIFSI